MRLQDGRLDVRFVAAGDGPGRWIPAHRMLTPRQEQFWVSRSKFVR